MTLDAALEAARASMGSAELPAGGASWALHPDSCRFLSSFISVTGVSRVLEFGSGFSTLVIGGAVASRPGNFVLSVDDSARYSAAACEAFSAADRRARAEFIHAPLRPRFYGPRLLMGYSSPCEFVSKGPFDLALIDAPHHDYGRESVMYDAFPAVSQGGYIVLDDANRPGMEKVYVETWRRAFDGAIEARTLEDIGSGICVIRKLFSVGPSFPRAGMFSIALRTARNYARYLRRSSARAIPESGHRDF